MFARFNDFVFPIEKILYAEYAGKKSRFKFREPMDYEYGTNVRLLTEQGLGTTVHISDKNVLDEFLTWLEEKRRLVPVQFRGFDTSSYNTVSPGQCHVYVTQAVQGEDGMWKTVTTETGDFKEKDDENK